MVFVCLSSLCSGFFFPPVCRFSSVAVSVVLEVSGFLSSSWLACGTFEVPRTWCSLWLFVPSQFLAGGRERIKWLKCFPSQWHSSLDIHLPLVKEWIKKAELRKYWNSFVVTGNLSHHHGCSFIVFTLIGYNSWRISPLGLFSWLWKPQVWNGIS